MPSETSNIAKARAGFDITRGVISADGSKKAAIERAALSLFAQNGIDSVSTKMIAASAGVSEGLIYRHFKNKDHLARSLMQAVHGRLYEIIEAAAIYDNITAQIRRITTAYCELADEDWMLFRYHILYLHRFPNISQDSGRDPLSLTSALLKKAMARGDIPTENAHILAPMALGIVLQTAQAKVLGYIGSPMSDHIDLFVRRIHAVLDI